MAKGVMRRLDERGDGELAAWDETVGREAAAAIFAENIGRGFTMFALGADGADGAPLAAFDPEAGEILAVPRMKAG